VFLFTQYITNLLKFVLKSKTFIKVFAKALNIPNISVFKRSTHFKLIISNISSLQTLRFGFWSWNPFIEPLSKQVSENKKKDML